MVSEDVRDLIGRKRTMEVLELLVSSGGMNYSEIEDAVNSSSDTISEALKLLCQYGLVERIEQSSRNVRYRPTATGREFTEAVESIENILRD